MFSIFFKRSRFRYFIKFRSNSILQIYTTRRTLFVSKIIITKVWFNFFAQRRKTWNQFTSIHNQQITNHFTTKFIITQAAFKQKQRFHTSRFTSNTYLREEFFVENLRQRWEHFELKFLSRSILRNFNNKRLNFKTLKLIDEES